MHIDKWYIVRLYIHVYEYSDFYSIPWQSCENWILYLIWKNKESNYNLPASMKPDLHFQFYREQFYILKPSGSLDFQNPWFEFIGYILCMSYVITTSFLVLHNGIYTCIYFKE